MLAKALRFSFLYLLVLTSTVYAVEHGPLDVQIEMVENDRHGQSVNRCAAQAELEGGHPKQWCFFYGEVAPHPEAGWEGIRSRTGCHEGSCDSTSFQSLRGSPYLILDISARPGLSTDRTETTISLQKLAGFTGDGRPTYRRSMQHRVLTTEERNDLVVPILISDEKEKEAFGVHEVFLRWRARDFTRSSRIAYGKIQVTSDMPRIDVLLDGGAAGRTFAGKPTVIENVAAGEHEVSLRDLSGREARKRVRVDKNQTVHVVLNLLTEASSASSGGLLPLGKNPQGYQEHWRKKDGALVVTIPGGPFSMGSPEGKGEEPERPLHKVNVTEFLMDKTEVTWGQFLKFSEETAIPVRQVPLWGTPEDYPVSGVTWDEAQAFCDWVGGRLPTEAEWEKAARGSDARQYPWGDSWDENRCNTRDGGPHRPMPAGAFPDCLSPYGLLDMAGSVWEWCEDWYDERYYETSPSEDPRGPSSGHTRVMRGGSWISAFSFTRVAHRQRSTTTGNVFLRGFRCVQSAVDNQLPSTPAAETASGVATFSHQQLGIEMEILGNLTDLPQAERCAVSSQVESGGRRSWWSTFGEMGLRENGEWATINERTQCGVGPFADHTGEVRDGTDRFPILILELTTVAMMKPEHAETTLTLSARKFSGFSKDAKPIYSTTSETRILKLRESSDAFFPIHVSDAQEREAWGVHEVLLRVRARPVRPLGPAYGLISTVTDAPGAAILLDGGLVGYANKEGTLQLRNVSPGERRLIARDRSGRETRRIVDVTRDRTTLVRLPFAKEQSSSRDFVPLVDNQHGYLEYRRIQDGAVMVRIPQGEFLMGNLETVSCPLPHKVYVSEFAIDKTPVTWGQFKDFSQETGTPLPPEPYWGIHDDHPVTFVTWEEARTYCEWVGGRLPTEAEREKAARGTDQRMFPWGNEEPNPELTVFVHSWGSLATEPAGSHPAGASPYGVLDMAGNVWEWCQDWYEERYYEISPYRDPRGPRSGLAHVVRGGSWDSRPVVLSSSARNWGYVGYREGDYGFRCATDAARLDRD